MLIQLPNDVIAQGYKQTAPFKFEQVFYSPSREFIGTEREFVAAGYGYRYKQLEKHTRLAFCN